MKKVISDRIAELTGPSGTEDQLLPALPRPRLRISPLPACIIIGLILLCVAAAVLREPEEEIAYVDPAAPSELVVAVVGEVRYPGLYTVGPEVRLGELLAVAEPLEAADLSSVNQAQKLADGQQITIPSLHSPAEAPATEEKLSINSATVEQLQQLPGIGPATASAIVAHRSRVGSFTDITEIMNVRGIGAKTYERFADRIRL